MPMHWFLDEAEALLDITLLNSFRMKNKTKMNYTLSSIDKLRALYRSTPAEFYEYRGRKELI